MLGELLKHEVEGMLLLLGFEQSCRALDPNSIIENAVNFRRKAKKNNYALFRHIEERYALNNPS